MNHRRRLVFALGGGALTVSLPSLAQSQKVYRVGILMGNSMRRSPYPQAFLQEMKILGYVDGQNVSFIMREAENRPERLPELANELVAEKVDVIVTSGTTNVRALRQATSTIPIVFALVTDPVDSGFVRSLARPGYNMTGTTNLSAELSGKRLELLREFSPKMSRIAILVTDEAHVPPQVEQIRTGAKRLGMNIQTIQVRGRADFDGASKELRTWRANAMLVVDSTGNNSNFTLLPEFAEQLRLPSMYPRPNYAEAGGLVSYGANNGTLYRRAAHYVDKILKGAKPADLPVELPTHFEMVINMKTAKVLGIKIPQSILLRADRLIE